jgi:hypothetical protein
VPEPPQRLLDAQEILLAAKEGEEVPPGILGWPPSLSWCIGKLTLDIVKAEWALSHDAQELNDALREQEEASLLRELLHYDAVGDERRRL